MVSSVINLIFKGQMEYAIISFSVGEITFAWLFHIIKAMLNSRISEPICTVFCFIFVFKLIKLSVKQKKTIAMQ